MAKSPVSFLKEVQEELKKVVWPTKDEVFRLTIIVIIISLVVGAFLGALDLIFSKAVEIILKR